MRGREAIRGCDGRRMGVCVALPGVCKEDAESTRLPSAGGVQRSSLRGQQGCHWRYCPTICRLGTWSISRCSVGFEGTVSRPWSRICVCLLREFAGRKGQPTAMVLDSRTLQSTPESGARAGYDGAKRRKGSKVHAVVDTLGHLLALHVTPADEQDRAQIDAGRSGARDHRRTCGVGICRSRLHGRGCRRSCGEHGIRLEVVKHTEAKRGFVLLPRRWVVESSFAWAARFRRLTSDYERLALRWGRSTSGLPSSCSLLWSNTSPKVNNRL